MPFDWIKLGFFQGLASLEGDLVETTSAKHSSSYVEKQEECNSWAAIPLHYKPVQEFHSWHLHTETYDHEATLFPTEQSDSLPSVTWHVLSKFLLLRKAVMTFYSLAKIRITTKCGHSLRLIRAALLCYG